MFKRFFENIDYEKLDEKEFIKEGEQTKSNESCLLYTSDAADEL